jgi:Fur family transcriptional regulator, peroxide stress response regulator
MSEHSTVLKKIGLKVTPQRLAILGVIKKDRSHPTAEAILKKILKSYPGISFATIYNTLSKLVRAGEIQELDIDPLKKRFDPYTARHYHFLCRRCNNIYDVSHEAYPTPNISGIEGHQVEKVQVSFKGVCSHCIGRNRGGFGEGEGEKQRKAKR